jgi:hypothetical protein
MSARKKKEIRKGYRQAGAIYWTVDMERIIRRVRASRVFWMTAAIVEACVIAGLIYKLLP